MRLFSNADSVRRGEVSVLAVLETIAANSFSFWIAWRLGTIKHLVIASVLLPILLLRTRLSAGFTHMLWFKIAGYFTDKEAGVGFLLTVLPLIKIIGTVYVTVRRPIRALRAIPQNFSKNVLSIDLVFSPQMIPGIEETDRDTVGLHVYGYIKQAWKEESTVYKIGFIAVGLPITLSAFAYRWAMKSAAVLWLPLIWIVVQSRSRDIYARLTILTQSNWARIMLAYSLLVLLTFAGKLALLFGYWQLPSLSYFGPPGIAATQLIDPVALPLWQVAAAVNAVLAWTFYFHSDMHLVARGTGEAWPEKWIRFEYTSITAIRNAITLYCVICTFYITAAVAWNTQWPTVRFILFPWAE